MYRESDISKMTGVLLIYPSTETINSAAIHGQKCHDIRQSATTAHVYNPGYSGSLGRKITSTQEFETSPGDKTRPCLKRSAFMRALGFREEVTKPY